MSKILWDVLKTLYNELNIQRQKFKMDTVTVPSKENQQTKTGDVSTLKDAIQTMTSHTQVGNEASTTSVTVPDQYSQMRQTPITQMRTVIDRISNLTFNAGNFTRFQSFSTNHSGFWGFNDAGWNGSNAAGWNGSNNAGWNGSNNAGHLSGNFSGDLAGNQARVSFGYNYTGFCGFRAPRNSAAFGNSRVFGSCSRCFAGAAN